jgi:hypothetical protein
MKSADLDCWARRLADTADRAASQRSNETELREDLDSVIREAAADLYGLTDREITAERRAGRKGGRRRYDKAYGGLVVEWEWEMSAGRRRHGAEQALDYLGIMRADLGDDRGFSAVVTDGREWGFLASDFPHAQLSLVEPEPEPDERFQWRENSAAACRRFLVLIGSNRQSAVTARALASAFGPSSDVARRIVALLCDAIDGRVPADRADTLYREWRRSLEVVYGNLDDDDGSLAATLRETFDLGDKLSLGELLFAVHTYFALIVRLVAIEVLGVSAEDEDSQPTTWSSLDDVALTERLRAIDAGKIPRGLEIQNLFEGDVFSWYLGALSGNVDLLNGIREALDTLQTFAIPRLSYGANRANDILRDLYLALVPRTLRKALGEFPTPAWLAGACLERLQATGAALDKGRVLDPTCGTGTFLMPVLRERLSRLRTEKGEAVEAHEVSEVLNSVVGFDINPIAVAAARVNYVTALGDLATVGPLTLPVWRADSILVPDEPSPQVSGDRPGLVGHLWTALRTSLPDPFPIPPSLATAERMTALRRGLEEALGIDDQMESRTTFIDELTRHFGPDAQTSLSVGADEWIGVREVSVELYQQILDLRNADRNGVWARIIENSFAPLFAGRFDVIVGNPPWLTWTKTPPLWREAAKAVWKRYGLWRVPTEGNRGSTSLASGDMAVLVFASALHRYASDDAFVGLLTPRSLVIGDPGGRAFRQFHLKATPEDEAEFGGVDVPFRIHAADDWSDVRPFSPDAANTPYFLVARPGEKHKFPVPTTRWERAQVRASLGPDWSATRPLLRPIHGHSDPIDRAALTAAWSFQAEGAPPLIEGGTNRWTFGKGLDTRGANGVFFVSIIESDKPRSRVLIENNPKAGRNKTVQRSRGWVESALVHPLLRGRDVVAWSAKPGGHIFAPYRPDEMDQLLKDKEFRESYQDGWRWLRGHAPILKARKPPPTRAWDLDGPDWCRLDGPMQHMVSSSIVVVRELQQQPAAAVIELRHDTKLGRTTAPLIDHKLMFCAVDSPDEAVYLAAVINSTPLQDLLASFANEIAVSPQTMARLPIPDFDLAAHQPVVDAGREAIKAAEKGEPVDQARVDAEVLAALGVSDYELGEAAKEETLQHQTQAALDLPVE